jgi:ABC-type amino acid transport system permease subunit
LVTLTAPAFNLRRQAFAYMAEVVRSGIEAVAKVQ